MEERDTKWDGVPAAELGASELQDRAARNLTWAREMLFPTQAAAARKFEINAVTYNRYEAGQRKISVSLLVKICAGPWGLTLDYFFLSDLSGVARPLALRLSAEHPVLLKEFERQGMLLASSAPEEADCTAPHYATRIQGKAKAPTA